VKAREPTTDDITRGSREVNPDDVNPRRRWDRHLPALGIMGVDFEVRFAYRRMHNYRIARTCRRWKNPSSTP
jgi:hypothetical protein